MIVNIARSLCVIYWGLFANTVEGEFGEYQQQHNSNLSVIIAAATVNVSAIIVMKSQRNLLDSKFEENVRNNTVVFLAENFFC